MTVVRELVTKLGFDVDDKKLGGFQKSITNLRNGLLKLSGVAAGVGGGLFALAKRTANVGDEIAKSARDLGIETESLQELRFAFEQSGVGSDRLNDALKDLNKSIGEGARGNETYVDNFNKLGISIRDSEGNLKSTETILMELSTAFQGVTSEAERNAIAQEILGESGIRVATALAQGQDVILDQRERARELGGIITEEEAKQAEEFNDTINELKIVFEGFVTEVGVKLIPVIKEAVEQLTEFLLTNREVIAENLVSFFGQLSKVIGAIAGVVIFLSDNFDTLMVLFKTLAPLIFAIKFGLLGAKVAFLGITGPIGLIIAGVTGLIWGLLEIEKRFKIFSTTAKAIGGAVKKVAGFFGFGGDDEGDKSIDIANERATTVKESRNSQVNNNNNVDIKVEVPEGSSSDQVSAIEDSMNKSSADLIRQLEQSQQNLRAVE